MTHRAQELAVRIIKEQAAIIGPLAWREAKKVAGLTVIGEKDATIEGKPAPVLDGLVKRYERLFGPASREICREAVRSLLPEIPAEDVPAVLK